MDYKLMTVDDIDRVIPMYIEYYNDDEHQWNHKTAYKRLHQIITREDSYSLIAEENGRPVAFAVGFFEEYDDITAYYLSEILVEKARQRAGIGVALMGELEAGVKRQGGAMIQMMAVNDEVHEHFYGDKLSYKKVTSLVPMSKWLLDEE